METKTNQTATKGHTMNSQAIAQTILSQLGGQARIHAMTGAYRFTNTGSDSDMLGGVSFWFRDSRKANCCAVYLMGDDTYTMRFWKIRGCNIVEVGVFEGAYCDMLTELFESTTGLYLSL